MGAHALTLALVYVQVWSFRLFRAAMSSGVEVKPECKKEFEKMKNENTHQYIIYRITDDKKNIEVEHLGSPGSSFEDYAGMFPDAGCRYGVYNADGKIIFLFWSDDEGAPVKAKMLYASSAMALVKTLKQGLSAKATIVERGDLNLDTVVKKSTKDLEK